MNDAKKIIEFFIASDRRTVEEKIQQVQDRFFQNCSAIILVVCKQIDSLLVVNLVDSTGKFLSKSKGILYSYVASIAYGL